MWGSEGESQHVMWAVTDMEAVPPGAMLINPQVSYSTFFCVFQKIVLVSARRGLMHFERNIINLSHIASIVLDEALAECFHLWCYHNVPRVNGYRIVAPNLQSNMS